MSWLLLLTLYCVQTPNPCPAKQEIANPPWNLTQPMTQAQCEEFRALVEAQQTAKHDMFVISSVCVASQLAPPVLRVR